MILQDDRCCLRNITFRSAEVSAAGTVQGEAGDDPATRLSTEQKSTLVFRGICFVLLAFGITTVVVADGLTVNIAGQDVSLDEPAFDGSLDEESQSETLKSMIGGLSIRQFTRSSVVAPVRIDLKYIKNDSGKRVGHLVHVAFVVHAPLDEFAEGEFAQRLSGDAPADESSHAVDDSVLSEKGIPIDSSAVRYQKVTVTLLEKIRLDAVLQVENQTHRTQNRIDFVLDDRFENQWTPVDNASQSESYSGFRGWLTATKLNGMEAVLIEAQFAMHEPQAWFSGSNFIRSKLPLVLQKAARDLRRKLSSTR